MKILSFLTMLFLTCQCYSQIDSTRLLEAFDEMYDQETMLLGEGYFMKKGAINKLGIFGKNIKHEMVEYGSQEALEEFSKFKRKRIQGGFLLLGGYMMGISAMVYAPQLVMSGPIIATGFVGLTFALVGVVLLSNAQKHLFKSVWIHNKNVLKRGLEVQMK